MVARRLLCRLAKAQVDDVVEIIEVLVGISQEPPPCGSDGDVINCISVREESLGKRA